ncbi:MAG: AAA family ATPase [Gammaproteobacteria bacterium]|nr:AAA family ATPase [Gammaproteobacteria bacterium]
MSKILVEDTEEKTRVPYLKGILIRSLQDAGLNFDEALEFATEIRSELNDVEVISTDELRDRVVNRLKLLFRPDLVTRYEGRKKSFVIEVENGDGQFAAFSPSEYCKCLETIGLKTEEAAAVAETLSVHLLKQETNNIQSSYIAYFTYRLLRKSKKYGPAVAHRWLVWRDFINSGRALIFMIGGTAGCGKSTTATDLASRLNILRTQSTDMLREVMRFMIPKHLQPMLHASSYTAWKKLPYSKNHSKKKNALLIEGYCAQAELMSVAIKAVIQRALRENVSLIIEGVHVHPAYVDNLVDSKTAVVIPVMLGIIKQKKLRRRITGRSTDVPKRRAEKYLKHFESIWGLQTYLLSEADKVNTTIIVNDSRDDVFREIMLTTINKLSEDFDKTPEQVFS